MGKFGSKVGLADGEKAPLKKTKRSSQSDFFQETSLHGWKYIRHNGGTRILWISVVLLSIILLYIFTKTTLKEYWSSPMRIQVNSTNTPLLIEDFPVFTFCQNNLISKTKAKKKNGKKDKDITTIFEYKEFAQPCRDMVIHCKLFDKSCLDYLVQVMTDIGWCCQVNVNEVFASQADKPNGTSFKLNEAAPGGLTVFFNVETYDYQIPAWYMDGILFRATSLGNYPEMMGKATLLTPGQTTFVNIKMTKIFTTESAKATSVERRNCIFPEEQKLRHFDVYSQDNCYVDHIIDKFEEHCHCVGKYRGANVSEGTKECDVNGSLSWMLPMEYNDCTTKGWSIEKVMQTVGCPSQCIISCQESQYSLEVSASNSPGFQAFCGDQESLDLKIVCLFETVGRVLGTKVCDQMGLFEDDDYDLAVWSSLCPDRFKSIYDQCKIFLTTQLFADTGNDRLSECLTNLQLNLTEKMALEEIIYVFSRSNILSGRFVFSEKYYTSISRDISFTLQSLICNVGGLLGLCLGCSFISIVEIVFFCFKGIPYRLPIFH